ncbi:unnamed protein product [Arabidopsis lyrata]|nr:unnamed protein product [Arabidopsis lyrata]
MVAFSGRPSVRVRSESLVCGCGFVETAEGLRTSFTVVSSGEFVFWMVPCHLISDSRLFGFGLVSASHQKSRFGEFGEAACGDWLDFFFLAMERAWSGSLSTDLELAFSFSRRGTVVWRGIKSEVVMMSPNGSEDLRTSLGSLCG